MIYYKIMEILNYYNNVIYPIVHKIIDNKSTINYLINFKNTIL